MFMSCSAENSHSIEVQILCLTENDLYLTISSISILGYIDSINQTTCIYLTDWCTKSSK